MAPVHTTMRSGSRFYVDPETDVNVPGVTSVTGMLPKPFLQQWAAKMTAELAVDSLDVLGRMAENDRDGAVEFLKGAARRYTKTRADLGSAAHDLFERMIRAEDPGAVAPDLVPYRDNFAEFLAAVNPELIRAEDVVWSDKHEYAGSFDAILRVWLGENGKPTPDRSGEPVVLIVDWKTSKAVYPEVALQLAAYAHGDRVIDAEGNSEPMPAVDGGAVLHVTATTWALKPVNIGEEIFDVFLGLRKASFVWERQINRTALGRSIASGKRLVSGTERRAR